MEKNLAELAKSLKIGVSTIYQWKKTRPELYEFLLNNSVIQKNEITKYYEQLTEEEQEMYLTEIKAIIMRRNLKK